MCRTRGRWYEGCLLWLAGEVVGYDVMMGTMGVLGPPECTGDAERGVDAGTGVFVGSAMAFGVDGGDGDGGWWM
jgi:hypothetical protein